VDKNAGVLNEVCDLLLAGKYSSAKEKLRSDYPFKPIQATVRRFSIARSMGLFMRDGFIDRYTGDRLINPGVLRLLHVVLRGDFPAHPNWKYSETHPAFWELFPTVDHIEPISRGGSDDDSNWVTTSMMRNQVKAQWSLKELGWTLHPAGDVAKWDGLSRWLVDYLGANPTALAGEAAQPHRDYIERWLKVTKATL
jgi:hypothetical protein